MMILDRHYHVDDTLQRSIVRHNGVILRRIARYVDAAGELTKEILEAPVWQERQFNGDFHNVTGESAKKYERGFIEALIAANRIVT